MEKGRQSGTSPAAYPTCGIRQPELACENFSSCFLLLADPSEEEYNLKPDTISLLLGTLTDLARGKFELVAENALLRQQVIILRRQVKRPACTRTDRILLPGAAGKHSADLETG